MNHRFVKESQSKPDIRLVFFKTNESYKFLIESLILAQDERWRRA